MPAQQKKRKEIGCEDNAVLIEYIQEQIEKLPEISNLKYVYKKAIQAIKEHKTKIETEDEAIAIKNIGNHVTKLIIKARRLEKKNKTSNDNDKDDPNNNNNNNNNNIGFSIPASQVSIETTNR